MSIGNNSSCSRLLPGSVPGTHTEEEIPPPGDTSRKLQFWGLGSPRYLISDFFQETGNNRVATAAAQLVNGFPSSQVNLADCNRRGVPDEGINDIRLGEIVASKPIDSFGGVVPYDLGNSPHTAAFSGQEYWASLLQSSSQVLKPSLQNMQWVVVMCLNIYLK